MIQKQIENLYSLITDGIIESSEGIETIKMIKEKAVNEKHNRSINQRSDGRFVTKVKDGADIKQISASDYTELINKLYDFYYGLHRMTLEMFFPVWTEYRKSETSAKDKTIKEDTFIWNAHLKNNDIVKKPMNTLNVNDYIVYFRFITKNRELTRKRFNNLKSVLNGMLYYAVEKGIISHNPLNDINFKQFSYKAENHDIVPYTELERKRMLNALDENDLYSLAIKLFMHLTIRIGELRGLRFDDICYIDDRAYIRIQRIVNNKNCIENDLKGHASASYRYVPLAAEAVRIICKIAELNNSEYMFSIGCKFITISTFNRRLEKLCKELNITYRSSHKIRFSNASILYKNGATITEIQGLLGHTTSAMTSHYLRNIISRTETYDKVVSILA